MRVTTVYSGEELNDLGKCPNEYNTGFNKDKFYLVKMDIMEVREITDQLIEEMFSR